jgi:hypothetical protein
MPVSPIMINDSKPEVGLTLIRKRVTIQDEPKSAMNKGTYIFHKPRGWQDAVLLLQKAGHIDRDRNRWLKFRGILA